MTRPIRQPDLLVTFALTAFSSECTSKLVRSGYRPTYKIRADYWSSAHHEFFGDGRVATGERCLAEVWLLTPEAYPHSLWVGRSLDVSEGPVIVGKVEIVQIFNPLIATTENPSH